MYKWFSISFKWQFENSYSYFFLLHKDLIIINGWLKSHIVLKASQKMDQGFMKAIFGKLISSIRLQKSDLERIFYYTYKYKIAIYTDSLSFHQSANLKIAITTSLYSIETSLLLASGLSYI